MSLKKFIIDSKMFENDKHYRECIHNNQPFIKARINPNNGNYYVTIDLLPCSNLTQNQEFLVEKLFNDEISFIQLNHLKNTFKGCNVHKELCWFDGIIPNRLESFCENLFNLTQNLN